jgi:hypothetical protein
MRILRSDTGSAMLVSLVVLLMLGVVGIAAVQTSETDMDIADNYRSDVRSFYTAEAGAEQTYAVLRDTVTWRAGFANYPFDGGSFTTTLRDSITDSALIDTVVIVSTGTRSNALSTVEVKLAPLKPFGWAAFGDDWMRLCGGTATDSYNSDSGSYAATRLLVGGNVGSNGNVKLCGTSDIGGDALTSSPGDLDIDGGATFNDTTSQAPVVVFDPVTQEELDYARTNSIAPGGLTGTFNYNNGTKNLRITPGNVVTMASGIYYFNEIDIHGDLELEPGASVKVYLVGDAKLNSDAEKNATGLPKDFLIFSVGDNFDLAGGSEIHAAVYAPETMINLNGQAELYGSFIGNIGDDVGGSHFHYDRSLRDIDLPAVLHKVSWREL